MFDRLKAAARQKLQRAVAEVVETELARSQQRLQDMHSETTAALDRFSDRLSALSDHMNHRLDELEQRARRDIAYSLDVAAAEESAAFVLEHLPKAPVYWHPHDTLRFALGEIKGPGLAVEFGVGTGTTLKIIAETVSKRSHGARIDIFTGLPETWRTGFPLGSSHRRRCPIFPLLSWLSGCSRTRCPASLPKTTSRSCSCISIATCTPQPRRYWTWLVIALPPMRCCYSMSSSTIPVAAARISRLERIHRADGPYVRVSGLHRKQRTSRRAPALTVRHCRIAVPNPGGCPSSSAST